MHTELQTHSVIAQSVVSRELAQLEDLLQWAVGCHGNDHEDVVSGQEMKEQAYTVQKVRMPYIHLIPLVKWTYAHW